tara:strand:+ start:980 stop:1165 length:186 start_codon:yes stop_codon:yes gene_type:complete
MLKSNKKNLLKLKHINEPPLLTSNSKGENNKFYKNFQKVELKKLFDINEMEIRYGIIRNKN